MAEIFRPIYTATETKGAGMPQTKNPGKQAVSAVFQGSGRIVDKVEPRGIEPLTSFSQTESVQQDAAKAAPRLAHSLAYNRQNDPNLTLLVERWDTLPEALRAGIMAMVKAAGERNP